MSLALFHRETNLLGVTREYYSDDEGNITVNAIQDLEPLLDHNKAVANDRGKKITSEFANPIATIPPVVALHWLNTEGWWVFDASKCPDAQKKLQQKLNDPDWRYLRTSELRM